MEACPWRIQLSAFHMKDFAHSRGEFKKDAWPEVRRRAALKALLDIAEKYVHQCVGAAIFCPGWRAQPERTKKLCIDPYYQCLQAVAQGSAGLAALWDAGEGIEPARVGLVFARRKETGAVPGGRAEQFYPRIIQWLNNDEALEESVTFGRPERFYGLQLADMIIYELARECRQLAMKRRDRPRYPYRRISQMGAMFKFFPMEPGKMSSLIT